MFDPRYLSQVRLLLRCLPEVMRQSCFALIGIPHLSQLPALKWKLLNIARMDRHKHALALDKLRRVLDT